MFGKGFCRALVAMTLGISSLSTAPVWSQPQEKSFQASPSTTPEPTNQPVGAPQPASARTAADAVVIGAPSNLTATYNTATTALLLTLPSVAKSQTDAAKEVFSTTGEKTSMAEFDKDALSLEKFKSAYPYSLKALRELADPILTKWENRKSPQFPEMALRVCDILVSGNFSLAENQEAENLAFERAKKVLAEKSIPANIEAGLVMCISRKLFIDLFNTDPATLPLLRREGAEAWIHAIEAIEKNIDPTFDVNDPYNIPMMTVPYPPGAGVGILGASPESIKDPEIRRQYVEALKQNGGKRRKYMQQIQLRSLLDFAWRPAQTYLIQAYGKEPRNDEELQAFLKRVKSEGFKQKILDSLPNLQPPVAEKDR